jgi:hypothetical protein
MRVDCNCLRLIPTARASTSFMLLILSLFPAFIHHNSPPAPREPIAPSPLILSQLAPATKRFYGHLRFHSKRSARRKAQATATLSKPIDVTAFLAEEPWRRKTPLLRTTRLIDPALTHINTTAPSWPAAS